MPRRPFFLARASASDKVARKRRLRRTDKRCLFVQQKEPEELLAPIEEWQALGSYLAAGQSAAKVAPRGDDPRFTGLVVTQGVEAPVERQEPPHLPARITGLKKKSRIEELLRSRLSPAARACFSPTSPRR